MLLKSLRWVRAGRFDVDVIRDFGERQFPMDDYRVFNPPVSEKQLGLLKRLVHKYRKQIERLEPWQRY